MTELQVQTYEWTKCPLFSVFCHLVDFLYCMLIFPVFYQACFWAFDPRLNLLYNNYSVYSFSLSPSLSLPLSLPLPGIIYENYLRGRKRALWYVDVLIKDLNPQKIMYVWILNVSWALWGRQDRPGTVSHLAEHWILEWEHNYKLSLIGSALKITRHCSLSPWALKCCAVALYWAETSVTSYIKKLQTTRYTRESSVAKVPIF